jgi:hypothetical protein
VLLVSAGLTAQNSPTAPVSDLQLESSDAKLVQVFQWAKSQALAYAHDGSDPGGPWYEAALPGRNSFCMRDVAHQTCPIAGRIDSAIPHRRITLATMTSGTIFDLLDAIVRMWRWTGNDIYLNDPRFRNFYENTATAYLKAWDLQPDRVLKRSRIMHQRLREGKFVRARGIPSYTEGGEDFNVGTDLLAAEYRAFESLRLVALSRHEMNPAEQYGHTADEIAQLIEHKAWSEEGHHFMGFFSKDGSTHGSGDAMVLYFGATSDTFVARSPTSSHRST